MCWWWLFGERIEKERRWKKEKMMWAGILRAALSRVQPNKPNKKPRLSQRQESIGLLGIDQIIFTEVYDQLVIAYLKSHSIMGILTLQTPCRLILLSLISNLHNNYPQWGKGEESERAIFRFIYHTLYSISHIATSGIRLPASGSVQLQGPVDSFFHPRNFRRVPYNDAHI